MKLSIIIKSKKEFEFILPLCEQMGRIQKEGKYLFFRFLFLCNEENHNVFKKCIKKFNVNVPYSILEFEEIDLCEHQEVVLEQIRDEIFRNPVESMLMIGHDDLNDGIAELASEYMIKILLLESKKTKEKSKGKYDFIFSTSDPECWNNIVETIIKIYKL